MDCPSAPEKGQPKRMRIKSYYAHAVEDAMSHGAPGTGTGRHAGQHAARRPRRPAIWANTKWSSPPICRFRNGAGDGRRIRSAGRRGFQPGERLSREVADLKKELEGMRRTLAALGLRPARVGRRFARLLGRVRDAHRRRRGIPNWRARSWRPPKPAWPQRRHVPSERHPHADCRLPAGPGRGVGIALHRRGRLWAAARPRRASWRWSALRAAGKTTTLVKLAVNYGLACRRPVLLLSMDTYRVAAGGAVAFLRRHPGRRFPGPGNRRGAGPGHRGEPRQGSDPHRYARARSLGDLDDVHRAWRASWPRAATSTRTWSCRLR